MDLRKKLALVVATGALTFGMATGASAEGTWPPEPEAKVKCNSGRGNGSETTPATDCDPGRSGLVNQGGD
jgi:hypothetical protein